MNRNCEDREKVLIKPESMAYQSGHITVLAISVVTLSPLIT